MRLSRKLLVALAMASAISAGYGQSADNRIGEAIGHGDWFGLYDAYYSTPKDSIQSFLKLLSRCMIGNRFNRTDISLPAFAELMKTPGLDPAWLTNLVVMYSMDMSRTGQNKEAASMMRGAIDTQCQGLDSTWTATLSSMADKYAALSAYSTYGLDFHGHAQASVPFDIVPVGPKEKGSVLMHLSGSTINGKEADITFDTGAGVNVICDSLARVYGLIPLDAGERVKGIGTSTATYAIAREMKLGDLTVTDVPFCVMDLSSGNAEADQYFGAFNLVVGSELMLQLKDLTLDFRDNKITVPAKTPERTDVRPNMCFSSGMNLQALGTVADTPILLTIDTGDGQTGVLGPSFLEANKEYVLSHGRKSTVRQAGVAGVHVTPCYELTDVSLTLAGHTVTIPQISVVENDAHEESAGRLGIRSLRLFSKVRFNLVDFIMSAE